MSVLKFQTNVPVRLHLRSTEGRAVESQFGGMQAMFTAEEGAFYVSEVVGSILADQTGQQPDGTFAVPKDEPGELEKTLAESIRRIEARKQPQQAHEAVPAAPPAWAEYLVDQSNHLIDAYSQVLTHASKYPNVRSEDIRSIFLSTFINTTKNGG